MKFKNVGLMLAATASSFVATSAYAQDEGSLGSAGTDALSSVGTDIATVGAAIIGIAGIAMGVKWVKATFF